MAPPLDILRKIRRRLSWRWEARVISREALFDTDFYREQNPDVANAGIDPVEHYLKIGANEGRDPHPFFCSSFYLRENPAVARRGANPLLHFIRVGDARGARPNPYFDPNLYRTQIEGRQNRGQTTLHHYLEQGDRFRPTCDPEEFEDSLDLTPEQIEQAGGWLTAALTVWRKGMSYDEWVHRFDILDAEAMRQLREIHGDGDPDLRFRFCFVDRGTSEELRHTLDSLRRQIHTFWEVIVPAEAATEALRREFAPDARIHFADPSYELLALPSEKKARVFVGGLQYGATLRPHFLTLSAAALGSDRGAALVYADEDVVSATGKRSSPILKPDWDPFLAAQVDLVGSSGVIAVERLRDAARRGDSSMSFDSIFRVAHKGLERRDVVHVPRVLVHLPPTKGWMMRQRVGLDSGYPHNERLISIAQGFEGPTPEVAARKRVSIIVPTRDRVELLRACLDSVARHTDPEDYEIVVVDNGSTDPAMLRYLETLVSLPHHRVIPSPGEFNYAALNNLAVKASSGDLLCFLNNDIEIRCPGWLSVMSRFALLPGVGAVGSVLVYGDGTVQHGGVVLGAAGLAAHSFVGESPASGGYMGLLHCVREVGAVTAACVVVRRAAFEAVGGFDAEKLAVNFNDVDLCLKFRRRGLKNIVLPLEGIVHHESKTRATHASSRERLSEMKREATVMLQRWGAEIDRDPHYNDNLSLAPETYRLASPPRVSPLPRPPTRNGTLEFSSLGREERLDIYADGSNETRVAETSKGVSPIVEVRHFPDGLSVLILNKNAPDFIVPLLQQLKREAESFAASGLGYEVIVGDTGSTDARTLRAYRELPPFMRVVEGLEYNFSRCNNTIEARATFGTALFMNNDIILPAETGVLLRGYRALKEDPTRGVLGAVLEFPNGSIQHMGCELLRGRRVWGLPYHINSHTDRQAVTIPETEHYPSVTGAFMLIERSLFHRCGRFDGAYRVECQDVALCLEAHRLGYRSVCVDLGKIIHIENGTRPKGEEHWGDRRRFLRRYGAYIQGSLL